MLLAHAKAEQRSLFWNNLDKSVSGYRIFRGYKEPCNAAERLPDVSHIVFVVHGVGGIMDESTIGRNASMLRNKFIQISLKPINTNYQ